MSTDRKPKPVLMWLGHYYNQIIIMAVLLSLINDILLRDKSDWFNLVLAGTWVIVPIAAFAVFHHRKHHCIRCHNEAPFGDPEKAVKKRLLELRIYHMFYLRLAVLGMIMAVYGMSFLSFLSTGGKGELSIGAITIDVITLLLLGYNAFVELTHRRFPPMWCPFCDDDDGWGGIVEPTPPTPPSTEKMRDM